MKRSFRVRLFVSGVETPVADYRGCVAYRVTSAGYLIITRQDQRSTETNLRFEATEEQGTGEEQG